MEIIKLNLIPSGVNPTCHCSQYDNGRVIRIELFDGLTPYVLQSGDTVTLNVRKPDNTIVTGTVSTTQGNNYVDIVTTEQICAVVGYNLCDLTITNGETVIGTLNFIMAVERDVLADGIPSQSVIEDLDALVAEAVGDNYYTKTEVDTALSEKADASAVATALDGKADKATTYTKTETDTLLNAKANSSDVYTKAQVDTALEGKADVDGEYKLMTVGNAEQLKSTVGEINKTPYNFRTSGGSLDIGDRETDKLIGGTIAFNQLVKDNFTSSDYWSSTYGSVTFANNIATYKITTVGNESQNRVAAILQGIMSFIQGHKYFLGLSVKGKQANINVLSYSPALTDYIFSLSLLGVNANNTKTNLATIVQAVNTGLGDIRYSIGGSNKAIDDEYEFSNPVIFDLTQMFGATIADYIYSLEQGQAGSGVAWFKKLFPKSYYDYNAGELMSVKTSAHNMVGFNAYNNATGKAKLLGGVEYQITGAYTSLAYTDINGDSETITPDLNGKFTPTNNGELTVTGGNATDTCVHIVWDGERDGDFEPYELNSYALDSDLELRGIPKLDANNNLYYDGDIYESSGEVTRKYQKRAYQEGDVTDGLTMITDGTNTVVVLATPTTEQADPFTNPQIVNDFGTEEYIDTRDVAIPVGHDTFYQANLRAKLEMSPDAPENNGDYLMRHNNGENTYIPYTSPIPSAPTEDGTYTLKVTVSGGTPSLTWVQDT